jgi:DNA repair protein SbcD/Mre11
MINNSPVTINRRLKYFRDSKCDFHMKVLHTSDWHLGCSLYGHKRYEEFEAFLDWLAEIIRREKIDVFLVAGDIFDTTTPSNRALLLYYQFLNSLTLIPNLNVIIVAGNHDSPSLINAPKDLLKQLHIHVFGSIPENPEDEVIIIQDNWGKPSLIVCAIPYLRDRDIRLSEPGESIEDKTRKLVNGVQEHYRQVIEIAKTRREELGGNIPIIAMGHLFLTGGKILDGDGVRELYVGNLARIRAENLCDGIDYLALGHLHMPQSVSGNDTVRYCGSPFALGFGDAGQEKQIIVVDFKSGVPEILPLSVPKFWDIRTIRGDISTIMDELTPLLQSDRPVWIEVLFSAGTQSATSVLAQLQKVTENTNVVLIKTTPLLTGNYVYDPDNEGITLEDLAEEDVFQRCMDAEATPPEKQQELMDAFLEILHELHEEDSLAE